MDTIFSEFRKMLVECNNMVSDIKQCKITTIKNMIDDAASFTKNYFSIESLINHDILSVISDDVKYDIKHICDKYDSDIEISCDSILLKHVLLIEETGCVSDNNYDAINNIESYLMNKTDEELITLYKKLKLLSYFADEWSMYVERIISDVNKIHRAIVDKHISPFLEDIISEYDALQLDEDNSSEYYNTEEPVSNDEQSDKDTIINQTVESKSIPEDNDENVYIIAKEENIPVFFNDRFKPFYMLEFNAVDGAKASVMIERQSVKAHSHDSVIIKLNATRPYLVHYTHNKNVRKTQLCGKELKECYQETDSI